MNTVTRARRRTGAVATVIISGLIVVLATSGCAHRGKLAQEQKRISDEEAKFAAGAGRKPTAATSYSFAKILVGQKRDRDAIIVLSRIIREHPKFLPAYNEIASIYVRSDRIDDSITVLSAGLKQAPNDGVLLNNLGMCYLLKGDHAQALARFTKAADAAPTNPQYRANRAAALALLGREKEAEAEYRDVLGARDARDNLLILSQARDQQSTTPRADAEAKEPATSPSASVAPENKPRFVKSAPLTTRPVAQATRSR